VLGIDQFLGGGIVEESEAIDESGVIEEKTGYIGIDDFYFTFSSNNAGIDTSRLTNFAV
jgi:hypothetical protein